ncbi:unspecific monooxygenase [Pacificibacter maritimus]|uniref:Unspecific monooxygenase n=1 Tax=Pacificibacter maritimus TaxID=762213 RepID=A0A3N4UKL2_9RHOB|nr:cytochrome P450 [Pacificibacter maritimus]RPE71196.1 unspecific monooxygenase [Pacificibacter maritimus]
MKTLSQNPKNPAFVQNPYETYDKLRALGPIAYWQDLDLAVVSSYDGVQMGLKDRRFGREAPVGFKPVVPDHLRPFYDVDDHSMLELEGDRHRRLRSLVLRAFTSRRIKELAPEITEICHAQIDAFPKDAPFDLLTAYATPIPIRVISRLLGVPEDMGDQLLAWSNAMVAVYTPLCDIQTQTKAATAATEFADFMRSYIDKRRLSPADDLITHLIAAEEDGEKLSTPELISTCILLLNAGHEATVHSIGLGVKTLIEHQTPLETAQDRLRDDTVDGTIEEILRYDPPLHLFQRWVNEDTTFLGHDFKRGDKIGLLLGAANRDHDAWDRPDRFDSTRRVKQNTAFGGGIHFCVGAPLARLEMKIALSVLFDRCPDLALTEQPLYADTWHFHGLKTLMMCR